MPKMLALEFNFAILVKFIVTKFNTLSNLRVVYNSQLMERFNIIFLTLQLPVMKISVPKKRHFYINLFSILSSFSFSTYSHSLISHKNCNGQQWLLFPLNNILNNASNFLLVPKTNLEKNELVIWLGTTNKIVKQIIYCKE